MSSDFSPSPREELEARITALLLGELPANEAEMLRRRIAEEPDLVRLHEQLKQTIGLVREAAASPQQEVAPAEAPKLSSERREKLLQSFKITRPKDFKPKMSKAKRREWAALAAMLIGLLAVAGLIVYWKLNQETGFSLAAWNNRDDHDSDLHTTPLSGVAEDGIVTQAGSSPAAEPRGRVFAGEEITANPAPSASPGASGPASATVSSTVSVAPQTQPPASPAKGVVVNNAVSLTNANFPPSTVSIAEGRMVAGDNAQAAPRDQVLSQGSTFYANANDPKPIFRIPPPEAPKNSPGALPTLPTPIEAPTLAQSSPTAESTSGRSSGRTAFGAEYGIKNSDVSGQAAPQSQRIVLPEQGSDSGLLAANDFSFGFDNVNRSGVRSGSGQRTMFFRLGGENAIDGEKANSEEAKRNYRLTWTNATHADQDGSAFNESSFAKNDVGGPQADDHTIKFYNRASRGLGLGDMDTDGAVRSANLAEVYRGDAAKAPIDGADMNRSGFGVGGGGAGGFGGAAPGRSSFSGRLRNVVTRAGSAGAEPSDEKQEAGLHNNWSIPQPDPLGTTRAVGEKRGFDDDFVHSFALANNDKAAERSVADLDSPQAKEPAPLAKPGGIALPTGATEEKLGLPRITMGPIIDETQFNPANNRPTEEFDALSDSEKKSPSSSTREGLSQQSRGDSRSGFWKGGSLLGPLPASAESENKKLAAGEKPVEGDEGVPIAGGAPSLGWGFRHEAKKKEAVIAGKPVDESAPKTSREEVLKRMITTASPDAQLANLVQDLGIAEQKLSRLTGIYGAETSEMKDAKRTVEGINDQLDGRLKVAGLDRELAELRQAREKTRLQIEQEKIEANLPKSGIVDVIDPADARPQTKPTLGERLRERFTGEVERSAKLKVEKDASAIAGIPEQNWSIGFDPYFIQSEAEAIQSKAVLSKVAEDLKLNEKWGAKHGGGQKLDPEQTVQLLKKKIDVRQSPNSQLMDIRVKGDNAEEAAEIANGVAEAYKNLRTQKHLEVASEGIRTLEHDFAEQGKKIAQVEEQLGRKKKEQKPEQSDVSAARPVVAASIPQPEIQTAENAFSTFSLNVSDVSFKLAAASLEKGVMPEAASVRSEEFINAFDYRDPEPGGSARVAFAWDRARYPFAHNRDIVRFSVKTAAIGREAGRPLNLVLLLDNSGSMERADRVRIIQQCLRVLASQLQPQDMVSVVAFSRTARLWVDGLPGSQAGELPQRVGGLAPEGGTNLEDAMNVAYQTALRHYMTNGVNRVVLLTDGAANLGDVEPESLKKKVEAHRLQGIALDCFGIGWEGYNDDLLEVLSRNGDGRYGFVNTPEAAATEFAGQLAGALRVAASDVKVQVEFNPRRVTSYRQIGYAKHQLKKEQFRDNTVDAAEIGAAEAGNALYVVETDPRGEGPVATVRVRFKIPGTADYREHEWAVPYTGAAKAVEQSAPAMRLATVASAFSEWLASSPFAGEVTPNELLNLLSGVPETCNADPRPKKLEWMIRQAKSISGK